MAQTTSSVFNPPVVETSLPQKSIQTLASTVNPGNLKVFNGPNRYATATYISKATYTMADTVILVQGTNFPDALSAGPLAYALNAPILLTSTTELSADTRQEMVRLGATKVIILGGLSAISSSVESELNSLGYNVERISGSDRYETALKVAIRLRASNVITSAAVLTAGDQFADALSAGSMAAKKGYPVLLTDGKTLSKSVIDHLVSNRIKTVYIIGGYLAIDQGMEKILTDAGIAAVRINGADRIETSTMIADQFFRTRKAVIANGWSFVDALAATPFAAKNDAPILLVKQDDLSDKVIEYVSYYECTDLFVAGGDLVVSSPVRERLADLIAVETFTIRVKNTDGTYSNQYISARVNKEYAKQAFDLQNQHRVKNGRVPLAWDERYYDAAKVRAVELSILFSHTRPDGRNCLTIGPDLNLTGENAAAGHPTPEAVIYAYSQSEGHNANMLRTVFSKSAIARVQVNQFPYWITLFGN